MNAIMEEVSKVKWYHRFEVLPGIITPGSCSEDPARVFDEQFDLGHDLHGQTIVEIGTYDGMFAFELERRGATVIATDIQAPDRTGFGIAHRLRHSGVVYVQTSVYDLSKHIQHGVDAVIFKGVLYHLKNPLLALENIWRVLKPGGRLYFETEGFSHYAETLKNIPVRQWIILAIIAYSNVPVTLSYPGRYKGFRNWFIPNSACLEGWLQSAGFDLEWMKSTVADVRYSPRQKLRYFTDLLRQVGPFTPSWNQRLYGVASRGNRPPELEHHIR